MLAFIGAEPTSVSSLICLNVFMPLEGYDGPLNILFTLYSHNLFIMNFQ